jgi:hypothetical protein
MHVLRPSLTLNLTPELFRLIEGAMASGAFADPAEAVVAALSRMTSDPEAFGRAGPQPEASEPKPARTAPVPAPSDGSVQPENGLLSSRPARRPRAAWSGLVSPCPIGQLPPGRTGVP